MSARQRLGLQLRAAAFEPRPENGSHKPQKGEPNSLLDVVNRERKEKGLPVR